MSAAAHGSLQNYASLGDPIAPKVVDSRRSIRIVIELDAPDIDWAGVVIPGSSHEDVLDAAPIDALDMLTMDLRMAVSDMLDKRDVEVGAVKARLGARTEYTTPAAI